MPLEPDDLQISPEQEKLNRQLRRFSVAALWLQAARTANPAAQPPPAPGVAAVFQALAAAHRPAGHRGAGPAGLNGAGRSGLDDRPAGAAAGATTASPVSRAAHTSTGA